MLEVEKGQDSLSLLVSPVYQAEEKENKSLNLSLESSSADFKVGNQPSLQISLVDEDTEPLPNDKVILEFTDSVYHLSESQWEGAEMKIKLSGKVEHSEILNLNIQVNQSISYGKHFTTEPFALFNQIKLDVTPFMNEVSFRLIPVNDNILGLSYEILLTMVSLSEGLEAGAVSTLKIIVEDDDVPETEIHSISEVRAKFEEHAGSWYFPEDYLVEGIVTSGKNVVDEKALYLQDSTCGIFLLFSMEPQMKKGNKVLINLKGAEGETVNEQKAITGVTDWLGTHIAEGQFIAPITLSLDQFDPVKYQGQLVRLTDVEFPDADGKRTFDYAQKISNGQTGAWVMSYPEYEYKGVFLPKGKVTVVGIVGDWNRILPQNYPYEAFGY